MVQDPHAFWERQRAYSFPGLSWNSIVTKFTVMVTDPATIRHVFNHNRLGFHSTDSRMTAGFGAVVCYWAVKACVQLASSCSTVAAVCSKQSWFAA